ncbi:MAG: methyltransferase domain-containing protein [Candidatus Brocadiae bacterium]|nr:methyltransferase domain-containing protein [Candidatus Brocadiia bacterium]
MPQPPATFEGRAIRRVYDEDTETWWFSVVDVVQALTQQADFQAARNYWKVLKNRLAKEGSESVTKCNRLKLPAADGKSYLTDVATAETLLRLIQSVPSPKAEPIKVWLARVGSERMQEMADPALSLERARETWRKHGRSEKWIQQRMTGQETRNKLTDYWAGHAIKKGEEFAILTNIIHQEWSGVSVKEHKGLKGLETQNLRDHMSEAELIFTALAELSTRQIAETHEATGMQENASAARTGGQLAKRARIDLERRTGQSVVSGENFLPPHRQHTPELSGSPHRHGHRHGGGPGHHGHSFADVDRWLELFEGPERDAWQKPDAVVRALALPPTARAADIGAGTGYFAVRLARAVPAGRVWAVDLEPNMVKHLKARAAREGLPNLTAHASAAGDPLLPEPVDLVLVANVYHHLEARPAYFRRLAACLAPGGRLVVIDFKKGDLPVGPPDAMKLSPGTVRAELKAAGLAQVAAKRFLPHQYFLEFRAAGAKRRRR